MVVKNIKIYLVYLIVILGVGWKREVL